jgi:hypothetical protein
MAAGMSASGTVNAHLIHAVLEVVAATVRTVESSVCQESAEVLATLYAAGRMRPFFIGEGDGKPARHPMAAVTTAMERCIQGILMGLLRR